MAGLRVVRGSDWKWGAQDGGEGHVGTVSVVKSTGTVTVIWDNGNSNTYRTGAEGCTDLSLLDNGPAGVCHPGIQCDNCDENNIRGLRWKCADCPDFDLCTECYGNDKHNMDHKFKRIDTPTSDRVNVGKRSFAVKLQARGIYPGAKVLRGEDWNSGDQDGFNPILSVLTDLGIPLGQVTKVGYVKEEGINKACCVVKWPLKPDSQYIYRLGFGGKMDLKYKTPAIGWSYYRDHLPAVCDASKLARMSQSSSEEELSDALAKLLMEGILGHSLGGDRQRETEFSKGDVVKVDGDMEKVQKLQRGHGGFHLLMVPIVGQTGVVQEIDSDGDVKVLFGRLDFVLNPALLSKVNIRPASATLKTPSSTVQKVSGKFKTGDSVMICKDADTVRQLQAGHGGWNNDMKSLIETKQVGIVKEVDSDDDIKVRFQSRSFLLNPAVCVLAKNKTHNELQEVSRKGFKVGDKITIDRDIDFVKRMQNGHGGWHADMKKGVLNVGIITEIDGDGDVKAVFQDKTWTLNPEVCHIAKDSHSAPKAVTLKDKNVNKNVNESASTITKSKSTCRYEVGAHVTLDKDIDFVMRAQKGHGGWSADMKKAMVKIGVVEEIDEDGDIKVDFQGTTWTLNPDACHPAPVAYATVTPPKPSSQTSKPKTPPPSQPEFVSKKPNINGQQPQAAAAASDESKGFSIGDQIKISVTPDELKVKQRGHGGWNERMTQAIGDVGVIKDIDTDGDLKVSFAVGTWTFNPCVCVSLDPVKSKPQPAPKPDSIRRKANLTEETVTSNVKGEPVRKSVSKYTCPVCLDSGINMVFQCGHGTCDSCAKSLDNCHMCRMVIVTRTKMFL